MTIQRHAVSCHTQVSSSCKDRHAQQDSGYESTRVGRTTTSCVCLVLVCSRAERDRQTDGRTDGQTDGRTDGRTDRQTDIQTDTETHHHAVVSLGAYDSPHTLCSLPHSIKSQEVTLLDLEHLSHVLQPCPALQTRRNLPTSLKARQLPAVASPA